jgi:hypothetical protein
MNHLPGVIQQLWQPRTMVILNSALLLLMLWFWAKLPNQHRSSGEALLAKVEERAGLILDAETHQPEWERFVAYIIDNVRFWFEHFRGVEDALFSSAVIVLGANAWAWAILASKLTKAARAGKEGPCSPNCSGSDSLG